MRVAKLEWTGGDIYKYAHGCDYHVYSITENNNGTATVKWTTEGSGWIDSECLYHGAKLDLEILKQYAQDHHDGIVQSYLCE